MDYSSVMQLIQEGGEPIIETAPVPGDEYVMRLGPNLVAQLQAKSNTFNTHRSDCDRIFTPPDL
jgi:hypothetical protein